MNDDNHDEYNTIIRLTGKGRRHNHKHHHTGGNSSSGNATGGQQHKYYPTNGMAGRRCRNAFTGIDYEWRVGSTAAYDNLFHTVDTTGKCDGEGYLIAVKNQKVGLYPNPNPNHLYYDDPEQFMRHQRILLHPELVKSWRERHQQLHHQQVDLASATFDATITTEQ